MNETVVNLLRLVVQIVEDHGTRIAALEREEFVENADDASLIEEVQSLMAQLQTPESAVFIPSNQV